MRALCLTGPGGSDQLRVLDLPPPELREPDQVRIRIDAIALNHLDLWVADSAPGIPVPDWPHIVGSDGTGTVVEVGSATRRVKPGDRVVINPAMTCGHCEPCRTGDQLSCRTLGLLGEHVPGTAAEQIVLPERNVAAIRGDWSNAEAAAFTLSTLTAWRMLTTRAHLTAGEQVLIWGIGGGVALAALQIARRFDARVAVTSGSDDKLERAEPFGPELGINHREHPDVATRVKKHFGSGVHVVVDSVGGATWAQSLRAMRPGGRLVTCGATTGPAVELDLRRLFWFQWSLLGSTMGNDREFHEVVALGDAGFLRPPIDAVYSLEDATGAYQRLHDGRQFGKLVLEVTP